MNDKRCQAMINAGIRNPESQKGIQFCLNHCPYDKCVVFETDIYSKRAAARANNIRIAKKLQSQRFDSKEIAVIMNISQRTVERYLKQ